MYRQKNKALSIYEYCCSHCKGSYDRIPEDGTCPLCHGLVTEEDRNVEIDEDDSLNISY